MKHSDKHLRKLASDLTKAIVEPVEIPFRSKYNFSESDISSRLENADWFSQCGQPTSFALTPEVERVKTWTPAIKSSKRIDWENFKLEARNQLSLFLFHNYREQFRNWNEITVSKKQSLNLSLNRRFVPISLQITLILS